MQGLLEPVDDAFGVEPPSRFAEALDHVRPGTARCSQAGIRKPGASMVTSRMLGSFRDDPATRPGVPRDHRKPQERGQWLLTRLVRH